MYVRSKVNVTYNVGVANAQTHSDILELRIVTFGSTPNSNFEVIGVTYSYSCPTQGSPQPVVANSTFMLEGQAIDDMYNAVKGSIPSGLEYRDTLRYTYYLAALGQMAVTFGVDPSDLEIVV